MNIVYATDDNYAAITGISMVSLLRNNRAMDEIHFYILDNGITEENRRKLRSLCRCYGRELTFVDAGDYLEHIDFLPDTHGFNPIVVVRLFLSAYLPEAVDKVLYLDGDTLVVDSLEELERVDMEGKDIAAVPELYMPPFIKKKTIGFTKDQTYYNAGVLWINLKRWRETGREKDFLAYYKENNRQLQYNDQDVINACCRDSIHTLPQWYNMSANFRYFPYTFVRRIQPAYVFAPRSLYKRRMRRPVIIHYMGDERPWNRGNHNWCAPLFDAYAARTPWRKVEKVRGKEGYMLFYHLLNLGTLVCPWGRVTFSDLIGINKYKWFGKK